MNTTMFLMYSHSKLAPGETQIKPFNIFYPIHRNGETSRSFQNKDIHPEDGLEVFQIVVVEVKHHREPKQ